MTIDAAARTPGRDRTVSVGDEVEVEFPDGSTGRFVVALGGIADGRPVAEEPLARAVVGRRPGERVTVTAANGVYGATIVRRQAPG